MAESDSKQATGTPATREGRTVSIVENRSLVLKAFRDGWVDSVELAEDLLDDAIKDVTKARESGEVDKLEMAKVSMALASIAQGAANMRTKAVQAAESTDAKQPAPTIGTLNQQFNFGDMSKMTPEQLKALANDPDATT